MLPIWLSVILIALTTHRVTRLITRDQLPFIAVPREAFAQRWAVYVSADDKHVSLNGSRTNIVMRSIAYLWECDWCVSCWVSGTLAFASYHWIDTRWWPWVLIAGTASSCAGLIAQREPD